MSSLSWTLPISVLVAMVMPLRFAGWEWVAFALSTPVVLWVGWPFHRAAWKNLRHAAATMDTLISLGTVSAWLWSTVVLVGGIATDTYFEVGAVVTTLIVLGRYLEARARLGDLKIEDCELAATQFMQMCQAELFLRFIFQAASLPRKTWSSPCW